MNWFQAEIQAAEDLRRAVQEAMAPAVRVQELCRAIAERIRKSWGFDEWQPK